MLLERSAPRPGRQDGHPRWWASGCLTGSSLAPTAPQARSNSFPNGSGNPLSCQDADPDARGRPHRPWRPRPFECRVPAVEAVFGAVLKVIEPFTFPLLRPGALPDASGRAAVTHHATRPTKMSRPEKQRIPGNGTGRKSGSAVVSGRLAANAEPAFRHRSCSAPRPGASEAEEANSHTTVFKGNLGYSLPHSGPPGVGAEVEEPADSRYR